MEIKIYIQMLQRGWWIVALTTLVSVFVALTLDFVASPLYRASTQFIISPNPDVTSSNDMINSLTALDRRSIITTYAEFMNSDRMVNETIQELQLDTEDLADYKIATVVLPDANILELSVEGPDAIMCATLANAIGQRGVQYISQIYKVYDISTIDPAFVPVYPFSPQPLRDCALALALGVVLGAAMAIVSEQLRVPIESLRERNTIDTASGVFNRRHFERRLETELIRSRKEESIFSICLIRMEGLTDFLDTLPTTILNRILRQTAETLRRGLKGTDIVGRWDQDIFGIILPSTPYTAAQNAMQRVRWTLNEPIQITRSGEVLHLNPMVGIARSQEDETLEDLIIRVEKELANARNIVDFTQPQKPAKPVQESAHLQAEKSPATSAIQAARSRRKSQENPED